MPSKQKSLLRICKTVCLAGAWILALVCPFNIFSTSLTLPCGEVPDSLAALPDSIPLGDKPLPLPAEVVEKKLVAGADSAAVSAVDSFAVVPSPTLKELGIARETPEPVNPMPRSFMPDPTRAVWLSALFPGLGQIYNRRYWKLPIVVGAFMGLGYGTSWNNMMLGDYTRAYNDITDSDPSTKSYMDFFPPTVKESDLDTEWLTNTFKARKDYCRRNRDLCIICMVGVYLVAMVDAYVDASLSQFDISPDLTVRWAPAVIPDRPNRLPGVGVQWAFVF